MVTVKIILQFIQFFGLKCPAPPLPPLEPSWKFIRFGTIMMSLIPRFDSMLWGLMRRAFTLFFRMNLIYKCKTVSQLIYNFETRQILCLNDNHLAETSVLSDTQSQSFNGEQSNVSVSHPDVISCDVLHSGFCSCEIWKAWNLTEIFHQRSSIEIPVGGQHNITQQISRKCVGDDKICESDTWWLKDQSFD